MMAVTVTQDLVDPGILYVLYNQADANGVVATADQNVLVEVEELFFPFTTTRVNISIPSNPLALAPPAPPGAPVQNYSFTGISRIFVEVPNFNNPGVNNNSLTIKGIGETTDRIIVAGSGRTAAARWSDETADELQVLFDMEGIDDLTVTAGGIINVSGEFSNDTNDASIHVIATVPEDATDQLTGTVVVAEATPVSGILPQPRLQSNFIEIIGAELDILGDIVATDHVILRSGEKAPGGSRAHLVLPYDVTVTGNPVTAATGLLELFSTKNIEQLPSSTLIANRLVAVSNNADVASLGGPWMINLGTETNDFDSISLGMTAAPGDAPNDATEGRIGVRDVDDVVVADFGILASTGQVRIDAAGAITVVAPIQATGLTLESDDSVQTTAGALMQIGDRGITVLANGGFSPTSTGDVTLGGRITIDDTVATAKVSNKIVASGTAAVIGGLLSPLAGTTTVSGGLGVVLVGPVQVGATELDATGGAVTVYDHDLNLLSPAGTVFVGNVPGNDATPFAVQATNIIAIDAFDDVTISGSVFAGTIYGNPDALTLTSVLPSISIRGLAAVNVTETGSLRTQAYQTAYDKTSNPLVGKITIRDASQVNTAGPITADGAVDIAVVGDISLADVTARENVVVRTTSGSISVQGPMLSTGATYTTAPAAGSQREPNLILDAPLGAISTSGEGTLTAGTVTVGTAATFGKVLLTAQQDIAIGADIVTPGLITVTSKLGMFDLSARMQADNDSPISISTGNGMLESDLDFAQIVTTKLTLLNTGAAGGVSDIDLQAKNNQINAVLATNFSVGGDIRITNNRPLVVGPMTAQRDPLLPSVISLASTSGITQAGPLLANQLIVSGTSAAAISLPNGANNVDQFAANNPLGGVTYTDFDGFETGVLRPGAPTPLTVEVIADTLSLTSVAASSTIRVVSGLRYRTLSIAAANGTPTTIGSVEYVTTSTGDNPPILPGITPAFAGTLRDMIRYANDNSATFIDNGATRPQPQAMVFDEDGYDVGTISVGAVALPGFAKPVTFDGGRLTDAVLTLDPAARLGILGSGTAVSGLRFNPGSNGSAITRLAVGGFTRGSGILLTSAGSTVTDVWAGLDRDGTTSAPNQVGIEVSGTGASGNQIGSVVVDPDTQNRISNNTIVGLLLRGGASGTRVFGSLITLNGDLLTRTGDGIRINGATNSFIGTPDAMQPDLVASTSNVIGLNGGNGIQIVNTNAGSDVTANRVRNNYVVANGAAGIAVNGSQFVIIGGTAGTAGNTVIEQGGAGISIGSSANVRIVGNDIGLDDTAGVAAPSGNTGNGVTVSASRSVSIASGNRIMANKLNGIAIANASTAVSVTGNTIGQAGLGNVLDGIAINSSIGNTVGAGNVVSSNGGSGASITNARATSLMAGNRVFGSLFTANTGSGVSVSGGSFSSIGGTKAGEANLIQSNGGSGITLQWNAVTGSPTGFAIEGNRIGTNANREVTSLGNGAAGIRLVGATNTVIAAGNAVMNNATDGIVVEGGTGNVVGGVVAGRGNEIGANAASGVVVRPSTLAGLPTTLRSARNVTIAGNAITANVGNGVQVTGAVGGPSVTGVTIGQKVTATGASGLGNVIHGNAGLGVSVAAGAQQVSFQGNSIADNALGGVSIAPGANRSAAQALALTSAVLRGTGSTQSVTISGSLSNAAFRQQQYSIDFYANAPEDGNYAGLTGYQARRLIGRATVVADASGNATFSLRITAPLEVGEVITATATALRFEVGSTSVLSNAVTADLPGLPTPRF